MAAGKRVERPCEAQWGGAGLSRFRGPGDHHLRDLGRDRQPRSVPGDPLHARGVRGRGAADRRRGRRPHPHPRPHPGRHAELRGRGLPGDPRRDPCRGRRRRDHQLLDRDGRRPRREADRLPRGLPAGGRGAQHGLDELRQVLAHAQGLRVQVRVRQPVRRDHRAARGDAPAAASSPSTSASTSATSARWRRWSTWACSRRRCTPTS